MIKRRHGLVLVVAALVGIIACLAMPTESRIPVRQSLRQRLVGYWAVHVDGGLLRNEIELFHVDTTDAGLRLAELPTRDWAGQWTSGVGIVSSSGTVANDRVEWTLELADGSMGHMVWSLEADTLFGALTFTNDPVSYSLVGVSVSPQIASTVTSVARKNGIVKDDVPLVLIRLDDLPWQDRTFIPHLLQRGLYGELAIPTAWVGTPGRPSWSEVAAWTQEGFVAAAHSRYHSRTKGSPQIFLSEVLGSLADLANRGHPSSVFVQPGTWEDSLNFDTAAKLENWRGAVFQTFTTVFEGYARPASVSLPLADSMAMGLGHLTVSNGAPVASVLRWWQLAQKPGHFTVLMAHSASLTNPDELDWFLDTLAVAVRDGRIHLAHSSADAFNPAVVSAVRTPSTPDSSAANSVR